MAEVAIEGPFGDLGLATYDEEAQEWHFARSIGEHYAVGAVVDGGKLPNQIQSRDQASASSVRDSRLQRTIAAHPELQAAADILPSLLQVSHATVEAVDQFDSANGTRLSLGYLYDYGQKRTAMITASVCGETGSDITVSKLQRQQRGWHNSEQALHNVPVLSGVRTIWKGSNTPIRQLLLARTIASEGAAPFLAARLPRSTLIFRLVLSREGFDISPVHEILQNDPRALDHADVAFNPWYPRQYATIDMAGDWSVWQLEKADSEPTCVAQHRSHAEPTTQSLQDGWRRMVWIGSPTMLVTCSRLDIRLYRIDDNIIWLQDIDVQLQRSDCWILDLVVDPSLPNMLFVLTGTHVLAYDVEVKHDGTVVRKVVMLRHYFNSDDLSLRLHVLAEEGSMLDS